MGILVCTIADHADFQLQADTCQADKTMCYLSIF